jgi:riboflavin kinase / FMN adenylyltransferase
VLILQDAGIPADGRGSVVTVGTFDGIHRGHQEVLREIVGRAVSSGSRSVLVTFDRHPLEVVRPEMAPEVLTTPDEKKEFLATTGLDFVVFLTFTADLSRLSPREFVERILVERIGVTELVIGYDHGFGHDRSGGVETLREVGRERGFAVDVVPPVTNGEDAVSSTRIRTAVQQGELEVARSGLGRPYSLLAQVVRGEGRGAGLGFPTANLDPGPFRKLLPPPGIYAVRVSGAGLVGAPGALHLGPRPTFEGSPPSTEVYLLDWEGDLYGERVRVDFIQKIRGVEWFDSADALIAQMHRDVARVRVVLASGGVADRTLHL